MDSLNDRALTPIEAQKQLLEAARLLGFIANPSKATSPPKETKPSKSTLYARFLTDLKSNLTLAKDPSGNLYTYSSGAYSIEEGTQNLFYAESHRLFRCYSIDQLWEDEFISKATNHLKRSIPTLWVSPPSNKLCLPNALLTLSPTQGVTVTTPSSEWLSTIQLPVKWNPEARCKRWEKFLREAFDLEDLGWVWEMIGSYLTPRIHTQQAIWLSGPAGNGKSTVGKAIKLLIGARNTSAINLGDLSDDRFMLAELYGKLLYTDFDAKKFGEQATHVIKKLISGDEVPAQRKFEQLFEFTPFGGLIVCSNFLPLSSDKSEGWTRRWITVPVTGAWDKSPFRRNQEDILNELAEPEELSGALNHAIEGWFRLYRRGQFDLPEKIASKTSHLKYENHFFNNFRRKHIEENDSGEVSRDELFAKVNEFADRNGFERLSQIELGRHMGYWFPDMPKDYRLRSDTTVRGYKGVELK